jgi:hypothetical protein
MVYSHHGPTVPILSRSWEQAERFARKMEADADPTSVNPVQPRKTTVTEAVRMFLNDEEARDLSTRPARSPGHSSSENGQRSREVLALGPNCPFLAANVYKERDGELPRRTARGRDQRWLPASDSEPFGILRHDRTLGLRLRP